MWIDENTVLESITYDDIVVYQRPEIRPLVTINGSI